MKTSFIKKSEFAFALVIFNILVCSVNMESTQTSFQSQSSGGVTTTIGNPFLPPNNFPIVSISINKPLTNPLPKIPVVVLSPIPKPSCLCKSIFSPICGSDKHSYTNTCKATCKGASMLYPGMCQRCKGSCPKTCDLVCGSDNLTYRNMCDLICIGKVNYAHSGECAKLVSCLCIDEGPVVCGADGNFYKNACVASCSNAMSLLPNNYCGKKMACLKKNSPNESNWKKSS